MGRKEIRAAMAAAKARMAAASVAIQEGHLVTGVLGQEPDWSAPAPLAGVIVTPEALVVILKRHAAARDDVRVGLAPRTGRVANMSGAILAGADFTDADLTGADFRGADLTGADFRGADLTWADLRGAVLDGASFDDAVLDGTRRGAGDAPLTHG